MSLSFRAAAAAVLTLALTASASAQSYPTQTVRIVVAYAPGGTGDIVARLIAVPLAAALGQNVVVENRAGATGAIGTQAVVQAAPDGHTLLLGQTGEISINQHWIKGLTYDAENDLQPIALASVVPLALVVSSKAPYSTMDEMAKALADKRPRHLRLRRHRHAGSLRRRVPQASHQGQPHPRALQGRGACAERSARRPRRHVFPRLPGGGAARQSPAP